MSYSKKKKKKTDKFTAFSKKEKKNWQDNFKSELFPRSSLGNDSTAEMGWDEYDHQRNRQANQFKETQPKNGGRLRIQLF